MNRNEKGIQIKLFHSIQKINYNSLRLEGWSIQSELKNTFGNTIAFFQQGIVSSTYYKKISVNGDLALRAKIGFTSNKLGPFGPFTLDSYLNLRGAGTQIDRGTGQLVFNIEYRHAIFETPKVCFQVVVFNHVGTWRKPSQNISQMFEKDSMMAYSGLGTRIFFTKVYDLILRLDYGISITNSLQSGFVFGIGQYF